MEEGFEALTAHRRHRGKGRKRRTKGALKKAETRSKTVGARKGKEMQEENQPLKSKGAEMQTQPQRRRGPGTRVECQEEEGEHAGARP